MRIACIGSRDLEKILKYQADVNLMYKIYYRFAELGIIMTSGLCKLGPDGIAQKAYAQAVKDGVASISQLEVYIGDEIDRQSSSLPLKELAIIRNPELIDRTLELAASVHPAWHKCGEWARRMHSRNCHQILGYDLQTPVDAVVCWTPNGNVVGGTSTALKLAAKHNIPIFNLGLKDKKEVLNNIAIFIKGKQNV